MDKLTWLWQKAKAGDKEAEEKFLGESYRIASKFISLSGIKYDYHYTKQEALQNAIIRIFRFYKELTHSDKLPQWIRKIARNTIIDEMNSTSKQWKSEMRFSEVSDTLDVYDISEKDPMLDNKFSHCDTPESITMYNFLMDKIMSLPDNLGNSAFILHVIDGMKYEEIAKQLNIPVGTVKSRISRAREGIKEVLELNYV